MSLRIRRGTETQRASVTFDQGELLYTTDSKKLYIGDGVTPGGYDPARPVNGIAKSGLAGVGLSYNDSTGNLDVSLASFTTNSLTEGSNNKYFTNQRAQDAFGALLAAGTQTGITMTYDSVLHKLNVSVTDLVGLTAVVSDTAPSLGGNLTLNNKNITGTGNISITAGNISTSSGNITASGTITASSGLGADLSLNSRSITGTGNISITGRLAIKNSGQEVSQFVGQNSTGSGVTTPQINMYTSRGTVSSPTASQPGDYLANLSFGGYKSGAYFQAVNFISILDSAANMSDSTPAGGLGIAINNNNGGNSIFRFSYQGVLTAPVFQATSYTNTAMNAIPNPAAGMIIFNSTFNHFYGHNGSTWVAFTGP
jgi:hypothetical protein